MQVWLFASCTRFIYQHLIANSWDLTQFSLFWFGFDREAELTFKITETLGFTADYSRATVFTFLTWNASEGDSQFNDSAHKSSLYENFDQNFRLSCRMKKTRVAYSTLMLSSYRIRNGNKNNSLNVRPKSDKKQEHKHCTNYRRVSIQCWKTTQK